MPHYLVTAYRQSDAYLQGVRANPRDTNRIVRALRVLCDGLNELAHDDDFWAALVQHLEANPPNDLNAHLEEVARNLDAFLEPELKALREEMGGDEDAARRLLDDLSVTVARAGFDEHAIQDVRDATEQFRRWVCTERRTLQDAIDRKNTGWRGHIRALRVAIGGTLFVAAAAVVGVNTVVVVGGDPLTGVTSMKAGIAAMMVAFRALRADLERIPGG